MSYDAITQELHRLRAERERIALEETDLERIDQLSQQIESIIHLRSLDWGDAVQCGRMSSQAKLQGRTLQRASPAPSEGPPDGRPAGKGWQN